MLEVICENLETTLSLTIEYVCEFLFEMYFDYEVKYENNINMSQPWLSLGLSKGKQRLWYILVKGKQLISSNFSFGKSTNYINIDNLSKIMSKIDQFDILI